MKLRSLLRVLRLPHLRARWLLLRDVQPFLRLQFLYFALDSGLLQALPATRDELVARLGVTRPELLDVALDLGVALKELARRGERYALRGARAKALSDDAGDPLAALLQELVTLHSAIYQELAARLRGAPAGNYQSQYASVVARSSRTLEPFLAGFVRSLVPGTGPVRLLEVGCGSGIYLRHAAEANAQLVGVAIDLQPEVIAQAIASLTEWGMRDRFQVVVADIRNPPGEVRGPFDLVTLHNNVYYFAESERPSLFRQLRSLLAPGGALALTTLMRGRSAVTLDLDIALRCTAGCTGLPSLDELRAQLREGGFTDVKATGLMFGEPLYGVVAKTE